MRLLAAAVVTALVACGQGGQSAPPLTVPEALEAGGEHVVEGYVFADEAGIRLCEAVAESFPPQCGGASLVLEQVTPDDFADLESQDSRYWSTTIRRVRGEVEGDTLTVTDADL